MFDVLREQMLAGSKLDQAIKDNNVSLVQELIEQNPDQNIIDGEISGVPKIMYAAQNGFWDIVKVLFNEGAEIDCKIEYRNRYFVHECIENAPEKILKAVLDYANLNNKNHNGENSLLIAINKGRKEAVDYIMENKRVDFSSFDKKGNNAAHLAAQKDDRDLFVKLIKAKCPLDKENSDGKTPLDLIDDLEYKDNLYQKIGKVEKDKSQSSVKEEVKENSEKEIKPVVAGLSKIKRK